MWMAARSLMNLKQEKKHPTTNIGYYACRPCEVTWVGEPKCWRCGRKTDVPKMALESLVNERAFSNPGPDEPQEEA